jgi:TP901 family phage tail tape measure protein
MAKKLSLGVTIGATLSSKFHKAIGGARNEFNTLGQEIKDLKNQRGLIEKFEKDQAAMEKTRLKLDKTQQEVMQLKLALRKDPSNKGLAKDLAKNQKEAERLSGALNKNRTRLDDSRRAARKAGVDVENLAREHRRLGDTLDQTRTKYARMQRRMEKKTAAGRRLGELRGQIAGVTGAVYGLWKIADTAIEFESAMADVRKTVDFSDPGGLKKLGTEIRKMSRDIPVAASGLAQIAAAGGQLGIVAEDLPQFTETVAKMATAFDMGPEEAGDAMAKLANIYQIPINEVGLLGDAVNHLSDNTAAKARDIVPVLSRVGGTAKQFGLSAVQVAALGDAFVALGKRPEVAGTAINAMLTKLQTATRQGGKFQEGLASIGMSAEELERSISKNGQQALEGFLEQVAMVDKQDRAGILADMFGMEYADDISLLTGSLDQYRKALGLVASEYAYVGSMTREFENRSKTTENELKRLKNSISGAAISLGSTLLPAINAVIRPVAIASNRVADLSDKFPWLGKVIGGTAAAVGLFVGAVVTATAATWVWNAALAAPAIGWMIGKVGALRSAITMQTVAAKASTAATWALSTAQKAWAVGSTIVTAAIGAISTGFRAMSLAIISNPIGLAIAGIALAAGLVIKYWEPIKSFFSDLWGGIKSLFKDGVGFLTKIWETSPIGLMFKAGKKIAGWVGGIFGGDDEKENEAPQKRRPGSIAGTGRVAKAAGVTALGTALAVTPAAAQTGEPQSRANVQPLVQPVKMSEPQGRASFEDAIQPRPQAAGKTEYHTPVNTTIHISPPPGTSEREIAMEVSRALDEREQQAQAKARGRLYD